MTKILQSKEQIQILENKLSTYIEQRNKVETMIDQYMELYQRLSGAIEATKDIIDNLEDKTESNEAKD